MIQPVPGAVISSLTQTPTPLPALAETPAQAPATDSATISSEGRALLAAERAEAAT